VVVEDENRIYKCPACCPDTCSRSAHWSGSLKTQKRRGGCEAEKGTERRLSGSSHRNNSQRDTAHRQYRSWRILYCVLRVSISDAHCDAGLDAQTKNTSRGRNFVAAGAGLEKEAVRRGTMRGCIHTGRGVGCTFELRTNGRNERCVLWALRLCLFDSLAPASVVPHCAMQTP
jgi:hypothetical protein